MRNGDFAPTRFEAQRDAVNLLFGSKLNGHPENTVALMTMADKCGNINLYLALIAL